MTSIQVPEGCIGEMVLMLHEHNGIYYNVIARSKQTGEHIDDKRFPVSLRN